MQRWDCEIGEKVEDPAVDAFVAELVEVCKRHNMSLSKTGGVAGPSFKVYPHAFSSCLDDLRDSARAGPRHAAATPVDTSNLPRGTR